MPSFRNFQPYKLAIEVVSSLHPLLSEIERGNGEVVSQLKRASISVVLNIGEGSGRYHKKDRLRFYSIACGSAVESIAAIDILRALKVLSYDETQEATQKLESIANILNSILLKSNGGCGVE